MSTIIWIVILIVALAAGIGAGYFIGYNNRKKTAEAQIGSAEAEATRLVNEAIKTAAQKRKEAAAAAEMQQETENAAEVQQDSSPENFTVDPDTGEVL